MLDQAAKQNPDSDRGNLNVRLKNYVMADSNQSLQGLEIVKHQNDSYVDFLSVSNKSDDGTHFYYHFRVNPLWLSGDAKTCLDGIKRSVSPGVANNVYVYWKPQEKPDSYSW